MNIVLWTLSCVCAAGLLFLGGVMLETVNWRNDCEVAGVHISGTTVYDCVKREVKK